MRTQLRLLVEEGGANLGILDRWGHSALDEAERIGANNVVAYLVVRMSHDEEQHAPIEYPLGSVHGEDDDEEPWCDGVETCVLVVRFVTTSTTTTTSVCAGCLRGCF